MTTTNDLEKQLTLALFTGAEITIYQEGQKFICEICTQSGLLVCSETGMSSVLAVMGQALRKWQEAS